MKHLIVLVLIVSIGTGLFGQAQFQKIYKPTASSVQALLQSAIQTSDGGYVMAGFENAIALPMIRGYVIKTDAQGDPATFAKRYGKELIPPPFQQEDPSAVTIMTAINQNADGTYIAAGTCNGDAFLMKLNATGGISWTKTFGGGDGAYINYVKQTSDLGYLATGYTYSNDAKDSANVYMIKLTSAGALSWDRIYRFSNVGDDIGYSCEETSDGYVVVGSTEQIIGTDTTTDVLLLKTNTSGTLQWASTRGEDADFDDAYDVKKTSDGNLIVSGSTSFTSSGGDAFIWKVSNATGDIQMGQAIGVALGDMGYRVDEKAGHYYVFGFCVGLSLMEMFATKIESDFSSVEQTWIYGELLTSENILFDGHCTSDNGFLLSGFNQSPLAGGQEFILIKTGPTGYSGCNEYTQSTNFTVYSPHSEPVTPTNVGPTSVSNLSMMAFNVTPVVVVACEVTALVANAGTSTNVCQGATFTLGATPTSTGGTTPHTYAWSSSPAGFTSTLANPQVTVTATATYTVTVTDASAMTATSSITLTMVSNPTAYAGSDVTICEGQPTQLQATGGTSWAWSPSGTLNSATISNPVANPTTTTTYTVTVTDGNGCTATDQVIVNVNQAPIITASNTGPYCVGNTILLSSSGGGTYLWNGPGGFSSTDEDPIIPGATVSMNGVYTVVVTGANTCTASATTTVSVGSPPNATASSTGPYCAGETIVLNSTGGVTYVWSGPLSYSSTDQNPTILNSTAAMSGTYTVAVGDAGGCTATATVDVVVNLTPTANAGPDTTGVCYGSSVQLNASGGGTYSWSPVGTLNNGTISNPIASPTVDTYYFVTITNDYNCSAVDSILVLVRPLPSTFTTSGGGQFCIGGAGAAINLNGSETGVNYYLLLGTDTVDVLPGTGSTLTFMADQSGSYTIIAVDAYAGCEKDMTGTVTVSNYPQPVINADVTDVTCYGDSDGIITIAVTNGAPPYSYDWSHDTTNHSSSANGLVNGDYTITVTDNNTCTATYVATIIQPGTLTITCTPGNVSCYGDTNGTASASPNGGTAPFLYEWSNGGNSAIVTGLAFGNYSVTVTDSHGCSAVQTTIVGQPSPLVLSDSLVNVSCYGNNDGLVALTIIGGNEPYTYAWSNGNSLQVLMPAGAGTFIVTVTDNNGCFVTDTFTLTQPGEIFVTVTSGMGTDHYGYGNTVSSGGSGSHSYHWSTGSTMPDITGLNSGTYYITVTDQAGCFVIDTIVIDIPVIIPNAITPNADGKNDDFEILGVGSFPEVTIEIFTRWGKRIFFFEGTGMEYSQPSNRWNGTHNGKNLPTGSYQYIIHLEGYSDPFTGQVVLVY